ncbi:MAG: hypothetical protein J6M22_03545 [Firmicutes bacterium]|nr:hypothetical protein [Bacillota bacterium]
MNRAELLELLVAQTERADRLSVELAEAKEQIKNREKLINQAGDLAAAATKLLQTLEIEPVNVRAATAGISADVKTVDVKALTSSKAAPAPQKTVQASKLPQPTLTSQQLAVLQKNRNRLTPQQLQLLKKEEALHYRMARQSASAQLKAKEMNYESKGIDFSAIEAITSGIGKGKV